MRDKDTIGTNRFHRKLILVFIFVSVYQVSAQTSASWTLNFGSKSNDVARALTEDNSGNILAIGVIGDSASFAWRGTTYNMYPWRGNCFITKQNPNGQLTWLRHIGGAGNVQVKDIATDVYDNFYLTGSFTGTADFNPSSNNFNLVSTDSLGDIFVAKYDDWGNLVWAIRIGGLGFDYASSIELDQDSNVFISGAFEGAVDFDPSSAVSLVNGNSVQDAFVVKLESSGSFIAAYTFGSTGTDFCTDLKLNSQEDVIVTGGFQHQVDFNPPSSIDTLSSAGSLDAFILKLNNNLTFSWVRKIGGSGEDAILATDLDNQNNIYLAGTFNGTCDFDPGTGANLLSANNSDGFIAKLNASGLFLWVNQLGGRLDDQAEGVAVDHRYNVHVSGYFKDTVDFDSDSSVTYNLIAQGNFDHYIQQLDSSGNFSWVRHFTGAVSSSVSSIITDQRNDLYSAGSFQGAVDFDPSSGVAMRTAVGQNDIFILRHTPSTLVNVSSFNIYRNKVNVYPNPTEALVSIDLKRKCQAISLRLYNAQGRLIKEMDAQGIQTVQLNLPEDSGVYFAELLLDNMDRTTLKIIKQ